MRDIFITKTRDEWIGLFNATDACVEPVFTISEVFSDRLALEREMVVNLPMVNGKTVKQIANPIKFSDTQPTYKNNDFCIQSGDQTHEICEEIGFSKNVIDLFQKTRLFD